MGGGGGQQRGGTRLAQCAQPGGEKVLLILLEVKLVKLKCTPPPPVFNEQLCPQKIWSEQECSLDMPFTVRDNIAKWQ